MIVRSREEYREIIGIHIVAWAMVPLKDKKKKCQGGTRVKTNKFVYQMATLLFINQNNVAIRKNILHGKTIKILKIDRNWALYTKSENQGMFKHAQLNSRQRKKH